MKNDCIEITGITPYERYPTCTLSHPCTQICEIDKLCVPSKKPDIACILQIIADVSIDTHKVICTPMGKKLVIEGTKHIKVLYEADEPCQNVHSVHFDIPFCAFILLKDFNDKIVDIFAAIEHISVKQFHCRNLVISIIIFLCPIFKEKIDYCYQKPNCDAQFNCNINVNCTAHANCFKSKDCKKTYDYHSWDDDNQCYSCKNYKSKY